MRVRSPLAMLLCLLVVGWIHVSSQTPVLTGVVTDGQGGVLPGVTVTVSRDGRQSTTTVTDERGRFMVAVLAPDSYTVSCSLTGFAPVSMTVTVAAGRAATLRITMQVGQLTETVTVTSERGGGHTSKGVSHAAARERSAAVLPPATAPPPAMASPRATRPHHGMRRLHERELDREAYRHLRDNPFVRVAANPQSTFSIDVDTASYANVRRFLNDGVRPPEGAVRIEEMINYFRFDYDSPDRDAPVAVTTEVAACPWNERHLLALVGVRATNAPDREPSARNLVFLVDVSGSMAPRDKLPLVKKGLHLLTDRLADEDRVAIVVYAGASGLALSSTSGEDKAIIHQAIDRLESGGSTNGGAGIELAYRIAREQFVPGGVNRVILATDGDFNVGVTSEDALVRLIEQQRRSGVFLSVLGVGTGNLQDSRLEALADKGNGNYAYLDSIDEARRVLVHEMDATLVTVAKDVKLQIEFNPHQVAAYRLIGYENRLLADEDFNDDGKDAGEIGAGQTVTALYEIVPSGVMPPGADVDALRYQAPSRPRHGLNGELMTIKLRYKEPDASRSERLAETIVRAEVRPMSPNLGFASSVAELGMLLRGSAERGRASIDDLVERARRFHGRDPYGERSEFIELAQRAGALIEQSRAGRSSQ
jgi:Ca-activated chloride channel family protein